jgi:hypothetical protein
MDSTNCRSKAVKNINYDTENVDSFSWYYSLNNTILKVFTQLYILLGIFVM